MAQLQLKSRLPVEDDFESWDDADFMIEGDTLNTRNSAASSIAGQRRDSVSSHLSLRSNRDTMAGGDERQVHLPGDDEKSTLDAIAAAKKAGIPIPLSVPSSALTGGTIRRLGGSKIKQKIQDDWDEDLDFGNANLKLCLKPQPAATDFVEDFCDTSDLVMPTQKQTPSSQSPLVHTTAQVSSTTGIMDLNKYRDIEDDDDLFGDGYETIKVSQSRVAPKLIPLVTPPTPSAADKSRDKDFEDDLELPSDGKLSLAIRRRGAPSTPTSAATDDFEWGEGSLGTRFGGTRRGRSQRSSSASAMSPSMSSTMTGESEDEGALEGLVIPSGTFNFQDRLSRGRKSQNRIIEEEPAPTPTPAQSARHDEDDFFSGLNITDKTTLDSAKLNLHRNVKVKKAKADSPTRAKPMVSLTFTSKLVQPTTTSSSSRLPRPLSSHHAQSLEPVSEMGGPMQPRSSRHSNTRFGHSAQSSINSIPTPTSVASAPAFTPSTPRKREVVQKTSLASLRPEPTTTSAQLLRVKRSLPAMKSSQSSARLATSTTTTSRAYERPSSRNELSARPQSALRPKSPVDRPAVNRYSMDGILNQARNRQAPTHLPAAPSRTLSTKNSRQFRRYDSELSNDSRSDSRAMSRATMRSPSPVKKQRGLTRIAQENTAKPMLRPKKAQHFGDGFELDGFDDLPTSAATEAGFLKEPVMAGGPKSQLRAKVMQNLNPVRTSSPAPYAAYTPAQQLPHFARDTVASRLAREASIAQRAPSHGALAPLTAQRMSQVSARSNLNPSYASDTIRSKRSSRSTPKKPNLIKGLNRDQVAKQVGSMVYDPETYRWEGNYNDDISLFDAPASSPSAASVPTLTAKDNKENSTPRPALISKVGTNKAQVVGGMVFDPQAMCWLKCDRQTPKTDSNDPMNGFNGIDSDDEDPFANISDLDDATTGGVGGKGRASDIKDEWLVGEEFDVGPEFIRRQRAEEVEWRNKCEKWLGGSDSRDRSDWLWAIRQIAANQF